MKHARNPAMRRYAHTAPRAGRASMLHCNICAAIDLREIMPTHVPHPHHHHHPGQGHPPASISPSILRMSALQRLAIAAALIALLWGAVIWAMKI
jgi:hypothetical protein